VLFRSSPVISATINLIGMYLMQINIEGDLLFVWEIKWLQDSLGVLLFTPFILIWFGNPLPRINTKQFIEGVPIYFAAVGLSLIILFGKLNRETVNSIIYLIIPIIIWASMKLNIHGLVSINLIISVLFLWGVANQQGALFNGQVFSYLSILFIFGTMWITSLILSSSIARFQKTQKSLSELSNHDQLTNLYNRLFFDTEMDRLEKSRQFPISIVMSDMDNLKQVNDTFGHCTGDEVLKNVALLLSLSFRQEDIVSRIGGDEFAVLLPNTGAPEVKLIIERMNNRIDAYNIKHLELPINISLGVSTANQGESLLNHLKIADNLMYANKQENKQRNVTRFIDKIKVNN
jgi:diguanylate cyclase (GGDEF)-like protein